MAAKYRNPKKNKKQERAAEKTAPKVSPKTTKPKGETPLLQRPIIMGLILALFGFGLYVNTISFEFALDDKLYVTHNEFTKKGVDGIGEIWSNELLTGFYGERKNLVAGGRYRPLPLTMHAIEWDILGPGERDTGKDREEKLQSLASFSHFMNAAIYGLSGLILFLVLNYLFPIQNPKKFFLSFPFLATAIWLAHPLHTEVVANIKSRDELMSAAAALMALWFFLQYLKDSKPLTLVYACLAMVVGLFSKESAIVFLGIIPVTAWFFTKTNLNRIAVGMVPLVALSVAYIGVRYLALGGDTQTGEITELMNNPFADAAEGQRLPTVIYTMGLYVKLLFYPDPLTHDYYPYHIPLVDFSHGGAIMSLLLYVGLIGLAIYGLLRKTMYSYGIIIYLGSFILFANLFFPIGTFMNERFMFVPSIGFSMIIAWLLTEKLQTLLKSPQTHQAAVAVIAGVLLIAFSSKTFSRNYAWESDYSLATTDVKTSNNSAKALMAAGDAMLSRYQDEQNPALKKQLLDDATRYLTESKDIYPKYKAAWHLLGNAKFYQEDYQASKVCYQNTLKLDPGFKDGLNNLRIVARNAAEKGKTEVAIECYNFLLQIEPESEKVELYNSLGEVYGKYKNDLETSRDFLLKAYELDSTNTNTLQKLGVVYAMATRNDEALNYFRQVLQYDPDNAPVILNIGKLYINSGQPELGQQYIQKARQIDPKIEI